MHSFVHAMDLCICKYLSVQSVADCSDAFEIVVGTLLFCVRRNENAVVLSHHSDRLKTPNVYMSTHVAFRRVGGKVGPELYQLRNPYNNV